MVGPADHPDAPPGPPGPEPGSRWTDLVPYMGKNRVQRRPPFPRRRSARNLGGADAPRFDAESYGGASADAYSRDVMNRRSAPRSRRPLLGAFIGVIVCSALGPATPALATPGDDAAIVASPFNAESTNAPGGMVTNKMVTCPAGERVVGGGSGPGGAVVPSYLSLRASSPLDETGTVAGTNDGEVARIWSASVGNGNPAPMNPYPERAFANCSANSDAVIEASTGSLNGGVMTGVTGAATTMCPSGTRAVGGGFASTLNDADFLLRASNPVDETGSTDETFDNDIARGWTVLVTNYATGARTFSVFALCSQGSDATVKTTSFIAPATGESTFTANCPANTRALGGGIGTTTAVGPYLTASAPVAAGATTAGTNTGAVARGWLASVFNAGAPDARYVTFALCASDPGFGTPPATPDTTPPETQITTHPAKKTKQRKAILGFSSGESGSTFECKLDKGAFASCSSPFVQKVKASRKGKSHTFSVVATDAAGNRDGSPATYSWKVKKKRKRR